MNLIFLYGPPAVGKLTIAEKLEQRTGYKLLHNYLLHNPISAIFPYENPANTLLKREFRLRILEEAIKNNVDLIFTFGIIKDNPFDHISDIVNIIESYRGKLYLVHVTADIKILSERVENQSRQAHGKNLSKDYLEKLFKENPSMFGKYSKRDHLTINTKTLTPEQAVEKIIDYYQIDLTL